MKPEEIDQLLTTTLEDKRLSRTEKQALSKVVADLDLNDDRRAFWRHRAFAVARDALNSTPDKQVLDWLEGVIKTLQSPRRSTRQSTPSETSVHFSPGDACLEAICRLLRNTRSSADICVFTITDNRLSRAIRETHERGVAVRIITDNDKADDLGSDAYALKGAGIPLRMDRSEHHMHHKYAIFDHDLVLTGSYNWTRSAARHNRENVMIVRDADLARAFQNNFDSLWKAFEPR